MAIYSNMEGYQVRITRSVKDVIRMANNMVVEEYFVEAVWDDPRLSSRLNGQKCWGHRMEKARNILKADGGWEEIKKECEKHLT